MSPGYELGSRSGVLVPFRLAVSVWHWQVRKAYRKCALIAWRETSGAQMPGHSSVAGHLFVLRCLSKACYVERDLLRAPSTDYAISSRESTDHGAD